MVEFANETEVPTWEQQYEAAFGMTPQEKLDEIRTTGSGQAAEEVVRRWRTVAVVVQPSGDPAELQKAEVSSGKELSTTLAAFDPTSWVTIIDAIAQAIINIMQACPAGRLFGGQGIVSGFRRRRPIQRWMATNEVRNQLPRGYKDDARTLTDLTIEVMNTKDNTELYAITSDLNDPGNVPF